MINPLQQHELLATFFPTPYENALGVVTNQEPSMFSVIGANIAAGLANLDAAQTTLKISAQYSFGDGFKEFINDTTPKQWFVLGVILVLGYLTLRMGPADPYFGDSEEYQNELD